MKKILSFSKTIFLVILITLISSNILTGQTCTCNTNGNWTEPATWEGTDPSTCTIFVIPNGKSVTISENLNFSMATKIYVRNGGTLTIAGGKQLDLSTDSKLSVEFGATLMAGDENSKINSGPSTYQGQTQFNSLIGKFVINGDLPIELVSFSGKRVGQTIALAWRTATERNNALMEVQRSKDGKRFEAIGALPSRTGGNANTPQDYRFTDEQPLPGVNYYRLRQVDFDGQEEYHRVIAVLFQDKATTQGITVFPTLAADQLNIALDQEISADSELYISDVTGHIVLQQTLSAGTQQQTLGVSQLAQGTYTVVIRNSRSLQVARFIKQ